LASIAAGQTAYHGVPVNQAFKVAVISNTLSALASDCGYSVMTNVAPYLFFAGVLLGMVCMFRINVRAFQAMEAWRPWRDRPTILGIRLRSTFVLEVIGLALAIGTIAVAIPFLRPA
jgi:hypothetical protein